MNPDIRASILKINSILKKTPSSLALMARNFINKPPLPGVSTSQPNPNLRRPKKNNLFNYGGSDDSLPNSRYDRHSKYANRSDLHKSVEQLSAMEGEVLDYGRQPQRYKHPSSDPPRGVLLSEVPFNNPKAATSMTKSKETLRPELATRSKSNVDWAKTPLFEEYLQDGITKYNSSKHQAFYDETEISAIYKLLKDRYSDVSSSKAIEPFFHKAMDTLGEILGSYSMTHVYRAIQKIYSKADTQNTLKLILRIQNLMKSRYVLFQIFHDILEFKILAERLEVLLQSEFAMDITRTYNQMRESLSALSEINLSLQNNFTVLTNEHKQL